MTLMNRLIVAAKSYPKPERLEVPDNHVGTFAESIRMRFHPHLDRQEAEAKLRAGEVKMLGVPLVVVPKSGARP